MTSERRTLGGFLFTATGVEPMVRFPSFEGYEEAWEFAIAAQKASGFWVADLLRYGESRGDWKERLSQVQHFTGLSEKRLMNIRAVGAIDKSRRRENVEFGLHEEVAGLPPKDQDRLLQKAESEGWDRKDMRHAIKKSRMVASGRAAGFYDVEVTVLVSVEAETPFGAEEAARGLVKGLLGGQRSAKITTVRARPQP